MVTPDGAVHAFYTDLMTKVRLEGKVKLLTYLYHRIFSLFRIQKHTRASPDITLDSLYKIEISCFMKKHMFIDANDPI